MNSFLWHNKADIGFYYPTTKIKRKVICPNFWICFVKVLNNIFILSGTSSYWPKKGATVTRYFEFFIYIYEYIFIYIYNNKILKYLKILSVFEKFKVELLIMLKKTDVWSFSLHQKLQKLPLIMSFCICPRKFSHLYLVIFNNSKY